MSFKQIPLIDISALRSTPTSSFTTHEEARAVCNEIGEACDSVGFFYVTHHGVDLQLMKDLQRAALKFFALPLETKSEIPMSKGGSAIRGYFPLGGELTSGLPDHKEGLYFGTEMDWDSAKGLPMHGPNLWPESIPEMKSLVVEYMRELTELGHVLMAAIATALGLPHSHFRELYTDNPFIPFRFFHYPADPIGKHADGQARWGVGRHTDYGVLTILLQDLVGGLQVENRQSEWVDAPPIPDSFVVNIGDMLEIWTGGRYKATPHRVLNSKSDRLSIPFFFDPAFECIVEPMEGAVTSDPRWRQPFKYGDYIYAKVCRCFPVLTGGNPSAPASNY